MQIKIKDKKSNIYYINNSKNFNELVQLVNKYDRCYPGQINSKKYSYLKEWINKSLPKLSNKKYSLSTKLYWIFNNLNDFPYCSVCHKQNGYKLKNVKTIQFGYYSECSKLCAARSEKRNQKIINTNIDRYGCKNVFQNDNIKRKIKTTLKSRYGVEIPLQSSKILNKSLNTKFELYGDPTFNNRNKAAKTCIEKYGTPNPMQNSGINKKSHSKYYFNNNWVAD